MFNPNLHYEYSSNVVLPNIATGSMVLYLDAGNPLSYPGTGTTWNDLSGNNYNSTISGATFNNSNYYNNFLLDGINDNVISPLAAAKTNTDSFTISFWSTPRQSGGGPTISRGNDNFGSGWSMSCAMFSGGSSFALVINGVQYTTSYTGASFDLNTFYHFSGTYNRPSGVIKMYVQGILVSSGTTVVNGTLRDSTRGFVLGQISNSSFGKYNISEVIVYNRVLTDNEIRGNYLYGLNRYNYYKH